MDFHAPWKICGMTFQDRNCIVSRRVVGDYQTEIDMILRRK